MTGGIDEEGTGGQAKALDVSRVWGRCQALSSFCDVGCCCVRVACATELGKSLQVGLGIICSAEGTFFTLANFCSRCLMFQKGPHIASPLAFVETPNL